MEKILAKVAKKHLYVVAGTGVIIILGLTYWLFLSAVVEGPADKSHTVKIKNGTSFDGVVTLLKQNQIIQDEARIRLAGRLLGLSSRLKAGKYKIVGRTSSYKLLRQLADGKVSMEPVTIPEGKQTRQIAAILETAVEVDSAKFIELAYDTSFVRQLGINAPSLEGFLFPETYGMYWGIRPKEIIISMIKEFKRNFSDSMKIRADEIGFSILETLTLASIIEGEAVVHTERETISGVYHNRLQRGMLLQADPTIQFLVEDGPRRLLNRDLAIDSPYNTYKYPGLPPGPVNNPGLASIKAALYPADVDYLYFVANGDGSHTFSRTLQEHLRAKAKFDQYRKKVRQMKRSQGEDG